MHSLHAKHASRASRSTSDGQRRAPRTFDVNSSTGRFWVKLWIYNQFLFLFQLIRFQILLFSGGLIPTTDRMYWTEPTALNNAAVQV